MKFAVYKDGEYWLTDTGVGGSFSPNVDDAQWWGSPAEAMGSLRECDLIPRDALPSAHGYHILRVK